MIMEEIIPNISQHPRILVVKKERESGGECVCVRERDGGEKRAKERMGG